MGVFVIFNVSNAEAVRKAVNDAYSADFLEVAPGQFLIATNGTAMDVSNRLQITDGKNGSAIVFSMGNYYGRTSTNTWDWIKTKAEQFNG